MRENYFSRSLNSKKMKIEQIHRQKRVKIGGYLKDNRRKHFIELIEIT
jgi:hypothetical protein